MTSMEDPVIIPTDKHFGGCPKCKKFDLTDFDGETISPPEPLATSDWSNYNCTLIIERCPHCNLSVYAVEVAVISNPVSGKEFINDNCFTPEERERYEVKAGPLVWIVVHSKNVSFNAPRTDKCAWLDLHFVGPYTIPLGGELKNVLGAELASSEVNEWEVAEALLKKVGPSIINIKWDQ